MKKLMILLVIFCQTAFGQGDLDGTFSGKWQRARFIGAHLRIFPGKMLFQDCGRATIKAYRYLGEHRDNNFGLTQQEHEFMLKMHRTNPDSDCPPKGHHQCTAYVGHWDFQGFLWLFLSCDNTDYVRMYKQALPPVSKL